MVLRIISEYDLILSQVSTSKQESEDCLSCTQLFQKQLTPSDVGKLNRLVIPKRNAIKYFPFVKYKREEIKREGVLEDVEIWFYDKAMKQWKFRYCYWTRSQSFAFTRGWSAFVKEKGLKEKDIIVFSTSNVKTLEGQSKNLLMIDVHYFSDNGFVVLKEVNEKVYDSSDEQVKKGNDFRSKLEDDKTKSKENERRIRLFGVIIQ